MSGNAYLLRRGQGWYVRCRVPAALVPTVGASHLTRSLKTSDLSKARKRRWIVMGELWRSMDDETVPHGSTDAVEAGRTVGNGRDHGRASSTIITTTTQDRPLDGSSDRPATIPHRRPKALANARPDDPLTVLVMLDRWLTETGAHYTRQTVAQHRAAVHELIAVMPIGMTVETIDRRVAGTFVSTVLLPSGRVPKTVNRIISSISSMWRWMVKRGIVETNPWQGQGSFSKRGPRRKRAYRADELHRLLEADAVQIAGKRYGPVIGDLLRLGLLTGCRLNELCELRVEDMLVEQQEFRIPQGKTENARRIMPVHRLAWPIITRRLAEADANGWLVPGLLPGGPDGTRSWIVSKRFTTFRRNILGDDDTLDFHSLRRTFATYQERASVQTPAVNTSTIAELMGHEKPTLALSVYSSGLVPQQLRAAIEALDLVLEPQIVAAIGSRP